MTSRQRSHGLFSRENGIQFAGLIFALVVVHLVYAQVIRPRAEEVERENRAAAAIQEETAFVPKRSIWIILKDFEQQACFTLLLWAMIMIGYKLAAVWREKRLFREAFIDLEEGERIIPQEALVHVVHIEGQFVGRTGLLARLLPQVVLNALRRFHATHSIQEVSHSVEELTEAEGERLESDLSLIRYIAWAIPSVGFIGTVRGIGEALGRADQAIKGEIEGVTASLGLAFNSTLIALFLSIILMYFIHLLQSREESLILEVKDYCRENLIAVMKIPFEDART